MDTEIFTLETGMVPGRELPGKGQLLLTNSSAIITHWYTPTIFLYKKPNDEGATLTPSSFMPNDILYKSLEKLVRDHYAPLTGWFEMKGTDIYLVWDNYNGSIYSPKAPVAFETATSAVDYDTFHRMVKNCDHSLYSKNIPDRLSLPEKGRPLLFVKVTRLESDNQIIAINATFNHILIDGCSASQFLNNWASLCHQITNTPLLLSSPGCADYRIPYPPLFGIPDFERYRSSEICSDSEDEKGEDAGGTDLQKFFSESGDTVEYCLIIPGNKQKEIREKAHREGVSFNIHLFAIMWKELATVYFRYKPEIIDNISPFTIIVDIRSKLKAPAELCTSAMAIITIKLVVRDILRMNVIEIAQLIKSKLDLETTPENICRQVDRHLSLWKMACQSEDNKWRTFNRLYTRPTLGMPMFSATSLLNFDFYDPDFGAGAPVYTRLSNIPINGMVRIHPPNKTTPDSSLQIYIALPGKCDISHSSILNEFVVLD